jgi:hypothetical protein
MLAAASSGIVTENNPEKGWVFSDILKEMDAF